MKTKQLLFTIALFLSVAFMKAQDKYEFMIIGYNSYDKKLSVSIDGSTFSIEYVEVPKEGKFSNANPLLKKVKEYQYQNWEVMTFNSAFLSSMITEVHFAYLKRKIIEEK